MDRRQYIIEVLENELATLIQTTNGYENSIQRVFRKGKNISEIKENEFPAIWFGVETEDNQPRWIARDETGKVTAPGKLNSSGNTSPEMLKKISFLISGIVKTGADINDTGLLTNAIESLRRDLEAFFHRKGDQLITSSLNDIDGVEISFISKTEPYPDDKINKGLCKCRLYVEYFDTADDIDGTLPDTPVISSPTDLATVNTSQPDIIWNSISGALNYHLQISTSNSFADNSTDQKFLNENSFKVDSTSQLSNGTYYTRVRAYNSVGYSDWSSTITFTVVVTTLPAIPVLSSPTGALTSTNRNTTFRWNVSDRASSFDIIVSSASNFSVTSFSSSAIQLTTITANLGFNTQYWWKVRGRNDFGVSDYSTTGTFIRSAIDPIYPNNVNSAVSWWNTYTTSGMTISSGISALLDQIGSNKVTQGTAGNRPPLVAISGSISAGYWAGTATGSNSVWLSRNDSTKTFALTSGMSGTWMFVGMIPSSLSGKYDNNGSGIVPIARSNASFGSNYSWGRYGINASEGCNLIKYPDYFTHSTAPCVLPFDRVFQLFAIYNGNKISIYKDGVLQTELSKAMSTQISNETGTNLVFGSFYAQVGQAPWQGYLSEFAFFSTNISNDIVLGLYEGHKERFNLS